MDATKKIFFFHYGVEKKDSSQIEFLSHFVTKLGIQQKSCDLTEFYLLFSSLAYVKNLIQSDLLPQEARP